MKKKLNFFWFIIIFLTFAIIIPINSSPFFTYADPKITLDLFSQKEPYNGKGFNKSSDMFGPQEEVLIYALLTADGSPICEKLVSFEIYGPIQISQDIRFHLVAETNCSGVATINFSLAIINQTEAFGTWVVVGRVEVYGDVYMDTLTFHVGWIIELLYIKTVDEKLNNRLYFGIGGDVGFEIALRNNAMCPKTAFLTITIFDELDVPINSLHIDNYVVPPNGKIQYLYQKMFIPKFAVPGKAKIYVAALDDQSVAYCPAISTSFWITIYNSIFLDFIDASIAYASSSPKKAHPGKTIEITALIRNEGTTTLNNFYVSIHANASFIDSQFINTLDSLHSKLLKIFWDTSGLLDGYYIITIAIQNFSNETDLSDNIYTFQLELTKLTLMHDIQVLKVNCSNNEVFQGEIITIDVTIRNKGNVTESTKLKIYYDSFLIQEKDILEIAPATTEFIDFQWNTTGVPAGEYRIVAMATPVEGEINIADNVCYGCLIKIKIRSPQIIHDVAISYLNAQPSELEVGELVQITIHVENRGSEPESFNVLLFYDNFQIDILKVSFIAPGESVKLEYSWDTSQVMEGNYTIKANIPPVDGEEKIANNQLVDGKLWIKAPQVSVEKHDVAIASLNVTRKLVYKGEKENIAITVANLGDFKETFNIFVYANMTEIWSYRLIEMKANSTETISFTWDTSKEDIGKYILWAKAEYITGETNIDNNLLIDGTLLIVKPPPTVVRDIGIVELYAEKSEVEVGKNITIKITVTNFGSLPESFNVTVYYDSKIAGIISITSLMPSMTKEATLNWSTSGVEPGTYKLSANATIVEEEINIENNKFVNGTITIKPTFEISFLLLITPFLIGLAIILLLILLHYARKKKKAVRPTPQIVIIDRPRV